MATDLIIARLSSAVRLLNEATNATEAKQVADLARAAEIYAQRQKLGQEAIRYATEVKVDALTLMGEFLQQAPKNNGTAGRGRPPLGGRIMRPPKGATPTLADAGITKAQSSEAQALASIKEKEPELHERVRSGKTPIRKATQQARRKKQDEKKRQEMKMKAEAAPSSDRWEIVHADFLDGLATLPVAQKFRLAFLDPPYNIGVDYGDGPEKDLLLDDEQYLLGIDLCVRQTRFRLTPDGSMWVLINDEYAAEYGCLLKDAGFTIRAWIKWYETFGVNCASNFNRTSRHLFYCVMDPERFVFHREAVSRPSARQVLYNDGRASPAGKLWDDVWRIPRLTGTAKERIPDFPTQLPLDLLRPIIGCCTDPGDWVIDPYSGSGTTGAACLELGRRFIGIEKSERFASLSRQRLSVAGKEESSP